MAYLTPEERISAAAGRGWRGLQEKFSTARAGTSQEGFNTQAPPATEPQLAASAPPKTQAPAERAKVKATNVAAGMPRQNLAVSHAQTQAAPVVSNSPALFTQAQGPGYSASVNLSPEDMQVRRNMAAINARIAGGDVPTQEQAAQIAGLRRQAGFLRGGTDRYETDASGRPLGQGMRQSNMDVSFDPSTSPAARAAFLADPVRPDGQIQRYQDYVNTPRGRWFGATPPAEEGKKLEDMNIGEMVVAGVRQKRAQVQATQDLTARGQDAELMTAGMRQRTADEQNRILAERATSEMGLNRVQTAAAEQEMAQAEEVRGLIDQFDTAKDDTTRNRLKARINMLTGREEKQVQPHFTTEELQGLEGGSRAVAIVPDGAGGFRKVVPQEGADPVQTAAQALTPEQRTKASKLIKQTMTQEEKAEILRKIGAGEL